MRLSVSASAIAAAIQSPSINFEVSNNSFGGLDSSLGGSPTLGHERQIDATAFAAKARLAAKIASDNIPNVKAPARPSGLVRMAIKHPSPSKNGEPITYGTSNRNLAAINNPIQSAIKKLTATQIANTTSSHCLEFFSCIASKFHSFVIL